MPCQKTGEVQIEKPQPIVSGHETIKNSSVMRCLLDLLVFFLVFRLMICVPKFERAALMKDVLVPADAAVKSAIFRLKAYDTGFDYPLVFKLTTVSNVVDLETLNCTRFNSLCQANVVLKAKLVVERFYDFTVSLENGRGDIETMDCSFRATNATTPIEKIFPGAPSLISISESSRRNSDVTTIIARGNAAGEKKVLLELFGPSQFGLRQKIINDRDVEGTIVLLSQLDYEKAPSHHLLVYANDPWTDRKTDTRNIATWPLFISVLDEQDTPPVFTRAPPTTNLDSNAQIGDTILSVKAEDGDKGDPRDVRYYLVSDDRNEISFADFFEMGEVTGELKLNRPIEDLLTAIGSQSPLLITIRAKELRRNQNDAPSQSTDVKLALLPPTPSNGTPKFTSSEYTANLSEKSPVGATLPLKNTSLSIPTGTAYILELLNDNSTFEISPNVISETSAFLIKVKNSSLLDYKERRSIEFDVSVRKFDSKIPSATSHVFVKLTPIDDDQPTFRMEEWSADLAEDSPYGASILKIEAYSKDGVEYTGLSGKYSEAFTLDKNTGVITLNKPDMIHSENDDVIRLTVDVTSRSSKKVSRANVIIKVVDVNDHAPKFERSPYEFIIDDEMTKFTIPAFVKAIDSDSTAPNNVVRYEMIEPIKNLTLNPDTGEIKVVNLWSARGVVTLHARAYDGGIPRRSDTAEVRIYPPESKFRKMVFVVPGLHPNRQEVERTLSTIVGQKVSIEDIRPYNENDGIANDIGKIERSVVVASVPNNPETVVDVREVQRTLDKRTIQNEATIERAEGPNLWWIFWLILILALIAAAVAMLCCICECCPWHVPPNKRFRKSQTVDGTKLVIDNPGQGKESKSVQVAEWFGRREAWSPDVPHHIDVDAESIRRHEVERGSDRVERHRKQQRQTIDNTEIPRDQLYIREGNADILRLITRGNEQQRPITLVQEQPYIIDSGKDILLRRFIDQQQNEVHRSNLNIAAKLQTENEVLEQSLRTQNALLRQILADREREIRLETQSLPAGTQTDHDVETQTEPLFLRPPKRKTRSDNEFSDVSDEEKAKYRRRRTRGVPLRRKITTPIQEESENNMEGEKIQKTAGTTTDGRRLSFGHTRTSLLRKKQAETKSKSALKREVLKEISASLLQSEAESDSETYRRESSFSDDSLEGDVRSRRSYYKRQHSESSRSDSQIKPIKYRSQTDLREKKPSTKTSRSQSQSDLSKKRKTSIGKTGSSARYMEWYNKGKKSKDTASESTSRTTNSTKVTKKVVSNESAAKVVADDKTSTANGPNLPLIQHSKNRFEIMYPVRRMEDDVDSGIALTRPAAAQKKSIFTIAYDDMQTRRIQQENHSPPL